MDRMNDSADQRIERTSAALDAESHGETIITVGKVLLWFNLILICFVMVGLRIGSHLFLWWVIAQGVLGVILVALGIRRKSAGRRTLSALEPTRQSG